MMMNRFFSADAYPFGAGTSPSSSEDNTPQAPPPSPTRTLKSKRGQTIESRPLDPGRGLKQTDFLPAVILSLRITMLLLLLLFMVTVMVNSQVSKILTAHIKLIEGFAPASTPDCLSSLGWRHLILLVYTLVVVLLVSYTIDDRPPMNEWERETLQLIMGCLPPNPECTLSTSVPFKPNASFHPMY
ncbi:hypothetical protein C8J57DRAFT_1707262, partial [Mycena rebaudengoi]